MRLPTSTSFARPAYETLAFVLRRQRERGADLEPNAPGPVGEVPGANFRSGKILKDRDVETEFGGDPPDVGDRLGVIVVRPMREVEANDVCAGEEQRS
jgi:hypothetical protein